MAYIVYAKMGFKENLKSELAYQDMSVKELANLSGISKHTLDNYLNVRSYMPSADVAVKIASSLGVTVEYLVNGEEKSLAESLHGQETRSLIQNFKLLDEDDRNMIAGIVQLYKNRRNKQSRSVI